jgi:hypothetical protein
MAIHATDRCLDSNCTISYPHGHNCPLCGTGVYRLHDEIDPGPLAHCRQQR